MTAPLDPNLMSVRIMLTQALIDAGVVGLGQQPSADQITRALTRLNWTVAQWRTKRWMSWHLIDVSAQSRGQLFYTIGWQGDFPYEDSGDFNSLDFSVDFNVGTSNRPLQIEAAYARLQAQSGSIPTDYPLNRIPSYEDYSRIRLKTQSSFPTHYFYDPANPRGKVYFWPIPVSGQFEMHVLVRQPLLLMQDLDMAVPYPDEYVPALELTVAKWLRMSYKMPPDPALDGMVKAAVNAIRVNNTQVPMLQMPVGLARGRRRYNIFSDEP